MSKSQNQSHVAKYERAEICISSENAKLCPFLFSFKQIICLSFCHLKGFLHFSVKFFHAFFFAF